MMAPDLLALILPGIAGAALGGIFFGGLWWTVRKSLASTQAGLWVLGSLLLRLSLTLGGFYLVAGPDWQRLLSCLAGFVVAREFVKRLTRRPDDEPARPVREARRAP